MVMKDYVVLAVFTYPHECLVVKSLLNKEHIRYFFRNETLVGLLPFSSYAFGGIQLNVHQEDYEEAKHILDSFEDKFPHLKIV